MGKTSSKSSTKWGTYCTTKTLSCNRWTAMSLWSAPKTTGQAKRPDFDPWHIPYDTKCRESFCKGTNFQIFHENVMQ